jgi:hypothetical protein
MKDLLGFILSTLALIYLLYCGYLPWFKPKQYLAHINRRRSRLKSMFPFLPNWLLDYTLFYNHKNFSIWWVRIGILLMVLMCIVGMYVSFFGPF